MVINYDADLFDKVKRTVDKVATIEWIQRLDETQCNIYRLAIDTIPEELLGDIDVQLALLPKCHYVMYVVDASKKADRQFMLATVRLHGHALWYADDELLKDRQFVLEAVSVNGDAIDSFRYNLTREEPRAVPIEEYLKDREIIAAACTTSNNRLDGWCFFRDVPAEIWKSIVSDRSVMARAIKHNIRHLDTVRGELRNDADFMLAAIRQSSRALLSAGLELKGRREFWKEVVNIVDVAELPSHRDDLRAMLMSAREDAELSAIATTAALAVQCRDALTINSQPNLAKVLSPPMQRRSL